MIYLIESDSFIKIGYTENIERRLYNIKQIIQILGY